MQVYFNGHRFHFECENLCRVFFPYSPVVVCEEGKAASPGEPSLKAVVTEKENIYEYSVAAEAEGKRVLKSAETEKLEEYALTSLVFKAFSELTGKKPHWGMLTGIHPVKLLREYTEREGREQALEIFRNKFFVSEKKLKLAETTLNNELPVLNSLNENDFSLYVSVPFCPTRCSYCSFVSADIAHAGKLIEPYFKLLLKEVAETAEITGGLGLRLISVYIGGGTPTTFTAVQLEALCNAIRESFDLTYCTEFTVEAGRPDTIDEEKLIALKRSGVTRISINPQSLNETVLKNIGRLHTAKDIENAFDLANKVGFKSINSDLIVGLEGDSLETFRHTLETVISYGASNITVHSLALKRSAAMTTEGKGTSQHKDAQLVDEMMDLSAEILDKNGYSPYYLYRQSRMAGNLENTGYARNNDICSYNIYTMDESSSVIALGAGGVSKLKDPYSNRLERIFNFKYPYEYISRNDEILERKKGVIKFYEQFRKRLH